MENKNGERRQFVRVDFPFRVFIYGPRKRILTTFTDDISQGGIQLTLDEKLKNGTLVDLEIFSEDGTKFLKGEVVWLREVKEAKNKMLFKTGIRFIDKKNVKSKR